MRSIILALALAAGCTTSNPSAESASSSTCAVDCGNLGQEVCTPTPATGRRFCCSDTLTPRLDDATQVNICVPCGGAGQPCCGGDALEWSAPSCNAGLTCVVGDWVCR